MKKSIMIFLIPVLLLGVDSLDLFKKANNNAENSDFLKAIERYELLIDKGYKILILRELNVEHRVNYSVKHFIKKIERLEH